MEVEHPNPQNLPDPTLGEELNPALEAASKAMHEALEAAKLTKTPFVIVAVLEQPKDKPDVFRVASNMKPEDVNQLMRTMGDCAGDAHMPKALAFAMVNAVCRHGRMPAMSADTFDKLCMATALQMVGMIEKAKH